jgi:hypothetical protein
MVSFTPRLRDKEEEQSEVLGAYIYTVLRETEDMCGSFLVYVLQVPSSNPYYDRVS